MLHSAKGPRQERDVEDVRIAVGSEVLERRVVELDRDVLLGRPLVRSGDRRFERLDRSDAGRAMRVPPREAAVAGPDLKHVRTPEFDEVEECVCLLALGVGPNRHVTGTLARRRPTPKGCPTPA
jgi:hypothetical protein